MSGPRVAVVGHVEWVDFLSVTTLPAQGQITPATRIRANGAGGAIVAAVAMTELSHEVEFFGAFGDDDHAERAIEELRERGITVHAARRPQPTREVITFIDARGERSITTIGERLQPEITDPLPWDRLGEVDGVYVTAAGHEVLAAARAAATLVVTPRILERLGSIDVALDAVVSSADDAAERTWADRLCGQAALQVVTEGADGGHWSGTSSGRWQPVAPDRPILDSYGAGDSFAAGFTFGLASGNDVAAAARIAAACGARALTHSGGP
jgi:ribokinase